MDDFGNDLSIYFSACSSRRIWLNLVQRWLVSTSVYGGIDYQARAVI